MAFKRQNVECKSRMLNEVFDSAVVLLDSEFLLLNCHS